MDQKTRDKILKALKIAETKRQNIFADITKSWDEIKNATVSDIDLVRSYYDDSLCLQKKFQTLTDEIIELNYNLDPDDTVETTQVSSSFRTILFTIQAKYHKLKKQEPAPLIKNENIQSNNNEPPKITQHMPPITIPTFTGNIEKWSEFFSIFNSLVHENSQLINIQKFHYLRTSVSHEALAVIENFQLTAENYPLAYQALVNRFQSTRRIATTYLNKILDYKCSTTHSLSALKTFIQVHQNSIEAIKALKIGDLANFLLLSLSLRNLDSGTARAFEEKQVDTAIPSYDKLLEFVEHRIKTIEISSTHSPASSSSTNKRQSHGASKLSFIVANNDKKASTQIFSKCLFCHKGHSLSSCPTFFPVSREEKISFLRTHRRCFNCFGSHLKADCPSTASCRRCSSRNHHTLLHPDRSNDSSLPLNPNANDPTHSLHEKTEPTTANALVSCSCTSSTPKIAPASVVNMLGTFRARIHNSFLGYVPIRGVIDPGSQRSFISQSLARSLGLKVNHAPISVSGIGGSLSTSSGTVSCNIVSSYTTQHVSANLSVIPNIVGHLPTVELPPTIPQSFIQLQLADPTFHRPDHVEILLGADVYPQLLSPEPIIKHQNGPVAVSTIFGWTIVGPMDSQTPSYSITSLISTAELSQHLSKCREIEHVHAPVIEDPLDTLTEQLSRDTHQRQPDERYSVSLLMKPDATPVQSISSKSNASLLNLQRRLAKTPEFASEYHNFMQEYAQLDHMSKASTPSSYIIPHHVVTKITNQSSKLRVVFNASSPDSSGVSLNDRLLKGPKLQSDVSAVLLNFRFAKVALCCDIQKMYRQVLVHEQDRHLQHIFWTPDNNSRVEEAQLNTVTYGLSPSAFLAMRVLHQLVKDEGSAFPLASAALMNHTYVDDIITGANDVQSASSLRSQLTKLLSLGGFELRKWSASHPQVLEDLPEEHCESPLVLNDEDKSLKILGLNWEPSTDLFVYRVIPFNDKCTIWSHIISALNPADMVSRGLNPNLLSEPIESSLWSYGPPLMSDFQASCPPPFAPPSTPSASIPELSTRHVHFAANSVLADPYIITRFSSCLRLQRVVAWMMRFAQNCRARSKAKPSFQGPLTTSEIEQPFLVFVRLVEGSRFTERIRFILSNKPVPCLGHLSPFLDEVGILRVGGRLQNTELPFSARIPALHPDPDGNTRVVTLRTTDSLFTRPVNQVIPLPE